jgi:hypothetical protein
MPNSTRIPLFMLSLVLVLPACAEETTGEPTVTTDDRGAVIVEQGGYLAITQEVPGGLVTEIRDAQTHEDLALFEYDEEQGNAVLELWGSRESQDVDLGDFEPTIDTVHAVALSAYDRTQESFRKPAWWVGVCCYASYGWDCGYPWHDDWDDVICCEWCTVYD